MIAITMQFMLLMVAMWTIPHSRYAAMDDEGGWLNPILFALMMALLSSLMMCTWQMAATDQWSWEHCIQTLFKMLLLGAGGSALAAVVLYPVWKLLGSTRSFLVSLKSVFWVMALLPLFSLLFLWLQPFGANSLIKINGVALGFWPILFFLWGSMLLVLATRIVHKISFPQAWTVAPIAWAMFALFFVLLKLPLWTAPIQMPVQAATEQGVTNQQRVTDNQVIKPRETKPKGTAKQNIPKASDPGILPEELGKLIVDNSFLSPLLNPELNRPAYYSPYSDEGGRRVIGVNGYRNGAGDKVVRIQIDPSEISYFYSSGHRDYESSGSSSEAVSDDAAAVSAESSSAQASTQSQTTTRRSVVSDASISILDESGNEIIGGMSFGQAQQYVLEEGFIYLIGEPENFAF